MFSSPPSSPVFILPSHLEYDPHIETYPAIPSTTRGIYTLNTGFQRTKPSTRAQVSVRRSQWRALAAVGTSTRPLDARTRTAPTFIQRVTTTLASKPTESKARDRAKARTRVLMVVARAKGAGPAATQLARASRVRLGGDTGMDLASSSGVVDAVGPPFLTAPT